MNTAMIMMRMMINVMAGILILRTMRTTMTTITMIGKVTR